MTTSTGARIMTETLKVTVECVECGNTFQSSTRGWAIGNVHCKNDCAVMSLRSKSDR